MGVKHRIAPIVVASVGRRSCHLPARQRGTGLCFSAIAQKQDGDAAFTCRQRQPPAGHQIQAFGHAFYFQQQRAHMRTGENVIGGRQGIGGIARAYENQCLRIAAQFQQPVGRQCAIFHRLIVGPDPEKGFPFFFGMAGHQQRQQRGKAAGAPTLGENFVQGTRPQAAAQHVICLWMTCGHRLPLQRQAIARQRMAQFRQLFSFVHDVFYNAPSRLGVNRNPLFVNNSQNAWALIKLTHT